MPLITAVIKKCRKKDYDPKRPKSKQRWCLYDHKGKKLLGRHPSKKRALRQERAIQVRKHGQVMKYARMLRFVNVRRAAVEDQSFEEERAAARAKGLLPSPNLTGLTLPLQRSLQDHTWKGYDYALRELTDKQRSWIKSLEGWLFKIPGWRTVHEILTVYHGDADQFLDHIEKEFSEKSFEDRDEEAWLVSWDYIKRVEDERKSLGERYPKITLDEMIGIASGELDEGELREIEKLRKKAPKPLTKKDISEKKLHNLWRLQQKKKQEQLNQWRHQKPLRPPSKEKEEDEAPTPVPADRLPPKQRALLSRVRPQELTAQQEVMFDDPKRLQHLYSRLQFLEDHLGYDHYYQKKELDLDDVEFALPYLKELVKEEQKLPATAHVVKFNGAHYQALGSIPFYPFEEPTQRTEMSTEKNPEMIKYAGHVYVLAADDEKPEELEMEGEISDEHLEEEAEEMDLLEDLKKHWKTILDKMPDDTPVDDEFEAALDGVEKVISEMESLHAEYEAAMKDMDEADEPEKEEDED